VQVHGIILVEGEFNRGESISIAGCDISRLANGTVGYLDDKIDHLLGFLTDVRKVLGPKDCFSASDWALLDVAHGRPYVRASARLTATGLLPFVKEIGLPGLTWAGAGAVLERVGDRITHCYLKHVFLTVARGDVGAYRLFPGIG
jgi:hypothetical protein